MKNESRNKSPSCILFNWFFSTHFKSFIRNIKQVIKFKLFPSSLVREIVKSANKSEIMATWRVHMYASQSSLMESGHNFQFIFFLGIKLWNIWVGSDLGDHILQLLHCIPEEIPLPLRKLSSHELNDWWFSKRI